MAAFERGRNLVPILLYVPVPHQGYLEFFEKYRHQSYALWLIGHELAKEFSAVHAEIREVDPRVVKTMLDALGIFKTIWVIEREEALSLNPAELITADEALSGKVIERYFPEARVIYDGTVFLRYDEKNVKTLKPVKFDRQSDLAFDRFVMAQAVNEAERSPDWWRHVGAVLVKDGQVVAKAYNEPVLSQHRPYILGNPRDYIEAGKLSQISDTLHSEKAVFAQLLQEGISARGADLYVSVFPCPDCAKLIAYSGIKRCFFGSGHASLDGEMVMRKKGVELVYVPLEPGA